MIDIATYRVRIGEYNPNKCRISRLGAVGGLKYVPTSYEYTVEDRYNGLLGGNEMCTV